MSCVIWLRTFDTTIILQRKRGIDTKIKTIEREIKNIMRVWEKKLSKNDCTNFISPNLYLSFPLYKLLPEV